MDEGRKNTHCRGGREEMGVENKKAGKYGAHYKPPTCKEDLHNCKNLITIDL